MNHADLNQTQNHKPNRSINAKTYLYVVYALYGIGLFNPAWTLIGMMVAYVKRPEWRNTIYEDHANFLMKTFWACVIALFVGYVLTWIWIGFFFIFLITLCWYLFRTVAGFVRLLDDQSITANGWWI